MVGMKRFMKTAKKRTRNVKRRRPNLAVVSQTSYSVPSLRAYPLGRTRKVTFVYSEFFSLNSTTGVATNHVFSANGCYDPNITGTGHQPRGFDQCMALFDHGTVIGSKIDVGFQTSDAATPSLVAVRVLDTSATTTSFDAIMETPKLAWTMISGTNGKGVGNLSLSCNPSKFLGRPKPMSEDNLRFSKSANPGEQVYYHISTGALSGDPGDISFRVRIEYTCVLTEPSLPTAS